MSKVIVFGSLNMDLSVECEKVPDAGETVCGSGFLMSPGGKGANQAYAAARMGAETYLVGAVGDDAFGTRLVRSLGSVGVLCDYLHVRDTAPTGTATIVRCHGDNRIVVDAGANAALTSDEVCAALDDLAEPGDVFLTQLECDFPTTVDALAYAREMGLYTMLNAAPAGGGDLASIYPSVDLLCVNESECMSLTGIHPVDDVSIMKALVVLSSWGVSTPVITLGPQGSVALIAEEFVSVPPRKVEAVDSTGAGDAYLGALAAELVAGREIADGLVVASAAGALACRTIGAQRAMPTAGQVAAFMSCGGVR